MRKKTSAIKETIVEAPRDEKIKESSPPNGSEERILFAISSATSMGQCPSDWHDYLDTVSENAWRFVGSPFSEARHDIASNAVALSKLSLGCIFLCDLFSTLHAKSKEKSMAFAMTTLTDRAERPVSGSFGGSFASYRMLSTRLTCLAKQKILNIPSCNFECVLDLIVRQTEKKNDRIVFIIDNGINLDEPNKLALKNILSRVRCHFLVLSKNKGKLAEIRNIVEASPMNSTFSLCKKPEHLVPYVYYFTDLILDRKGVPMKGVALKFGSKAPIRIKLSRLTSKEISEEETLPKPTQQPKKENLSVPRKITSWTYKKRRLLNRWKKSGKLAQNSNPFHIQTIETVGFLAANMGEKYINGVGTDELFLVQNAYTDNDCAGDETQFSKKMQIYTKSLMELLMQGLIKTSSVAFCQIRRTSKPPRYCFLIAVGNGILANEEIPLSDCHLVLGLLSDSIHPETWSHLLNFISAPEVKPLSTATKSRLITHANWINGEYLSRDTATKLSKLIKKNSVPDVHEDLNRIYTHAKVISLGYGWFSDMIKNLIDSARSPEMKTMLVNYNAEVRKFLK